MNLRGKPLLTLVLLLAAASCAPAAATTSIPATPSATPRPTDTDTPTPAITTTPTIPPDARLKIECLGILPEWPADIVSEGVLVLDSQVDQGNGLVSPESFMLNLAGRIEQQITKPDENMVLFAVTPDRKQLLALGGVRDADKPWSLAIFSSDGKSKVVPWDESRDGEPISWLDNERLLMEIQPAWTGEPATLPEPNPPEFWTWNPITKEKQHLLANVPDYYISPSVPAWSVFDYAPTLDRVVYSQSDGDFQGPFNEVLWDVRQKRKLATLQIGQDLLVRPEWNQDGNQFAIPLPKAGDYSTPELFLVDREGKVSQLTNMTTYYPGLYIESMSWSPDGSKIAFWFSSQMSAPRYLAVADLTTGEVINYCVPGDEFGYDQRVPAPLWSPDGKQLVVQNLYIQETYQGMPTGWHTKLLLVDPERGVAAQIAEDMEPVAWMAPP